MNKFLTFLLILKDAMETLLCHDNNFTTSVERLLGMWKIQSKRYFQRLNQRAGQLLDVTNGKDVTDRFISVIFS